MNRELQNLILNDKIQTPAYVYDLDLLQETLNRLKAAADKYFVKAHYAIKANYNPEVLSLIQQMDLGIDTVSAGEIELAGNAGFSFNQISFAGVGKTDDEIDFAIRNQIESINIESLHELQIVQERAALLQMQVRVALRINPNISCKTHKNIQTGNSYNKFGIDISNLALAVHLLKQSPNLDFVGLHFHIGSQIQDMVPFIRLAKLAEHCVHECENSGLKSEFVNFGGGLGIDYVNPEINSLPNFDQFFRTLRTHFKLNLPIHVELGRSIVGQCGYLLSRVLYRKEFYGMNDMFIIDAGMTELMRPALYQAKHKIINISNSNTSLKEFQVVGPVCESTDSFGMQSLPENTERGDLVVICSAGAYGEVMANSYNSRKLKMPLAYSKVVA